MQQMKDETSHMLVNLPETGKSLWGAASAIPGTFSYAQTYWGNGTVSQDLNGLGQELSAYGTYLANNPDQIAGGIGQGVAVVGSMVSPGALVERANTVTKAGRIVNGVEELANAGEEIVHLADETVKVVVDHSGFDKLAPRPGGGVDIALGLTETANHSPGLLMRFAKKWMQSISGSGKMRASENGMAHSSHSLTRQQPRLTGSISTSARWISNERRRRPLTSISGRTLRIQRSIQSSRRLCCLKKRLSTEMV